MEKKTFYPESAEKWRWWLEKNHAQEASVWIIFYKKHTGKPSLTWSEAVDEALCFGWIDSVKKTLDEERYIQFFSKRKPNSTWSKINKEKVQELIDNDRMMPMGYKSIELAQQNGSWSILDEVEALIVPEDLETHFEVHPNAKAFYTHQSKSIQKQLLSWIVLAKRAETREKRIAEIVAHAQNGRLPENFR